MKAVLDIGILGVIVLMTTAVGMELEARHFRAMAQRKGALLLVAGMAVRRGRPEFVERHGTPRRSVRHRLRRASRGACLGGRRHPAESD